MQSQYLERQLRENNGHREGVTANDSERRLAMRENRGREKKKLQRFCLPRELSWKEVCQNGGRSDKGCFERRNKCKDDDICVDIRWLFFLRFEVSRFEKEERRRE